MFVSAHGEARGGRGPSEPPDWGRIFASVANATGWNFRDIGDLTLDDLLDLSDEWRQHPPLTYMVQMLVEGLSGEKLAKDPDPEQHTTPDALMRDLALSGI